MKRKKKTLADYAEELCDEANKLLPQEEKDRVYADLLTIPRTYATSDTISHAIAIGILASALNRYVLNRIFSTKTK